MQPRTHRPTGKLACRKCIPAQPEFNQGLHCVVTQGLCDVSDNTAAVMDSAS